MPESPMAVLPIEKIIASASLDKGKNVGIRVKSKGNPEITLEFRTEELALSLPFFLEAISVARKEAGDARQEAYAIAKGAGISWTPGDKMLELNFDLEGGANFVMQISRLGAAGLVDALQSALGSGTTNPSRAN